MALGLPLGGAAYWQVPGSRRMALIHKHQSIMRWFLLLREMNKYEFISSAIPGSALERSGALQSAMRRGAWVLYYSVLQIRALIYAFLRITLEYSQIQHAGGSSSFGPCLLEHSLAIHTSSGTLCSSLGCDHRAQTDCTIFSKSYQSVCYLCNKSIH